MATKQQPQPSRRRRGCSCLRLLVVLGLILLAGALFLRVGGSVATVFEACPRSGPAPLITTLRPAGGRVDWSKQRNLIAYDRPSADGDYEIFIMEPDGSNDRCITCNAAELAAPGHRGNPTWHPSGEYLVFQAEKPRDDASGFQATPGFGARSDLWLAAADGSAFYQLTDLPNSTDQGVLHPHFSPAGDQLIWSQMYAGPDLSELKQEFGFWQIHVADFAITPQGPQLSAEQAFEPLGPAFYETHAFAPEREDVLLFSSNAAKDRVVSLENHLYLLDLADLTTTQLTFDGYSEHAHFSPAGEWIAWMWNRDNPNRGTDLWLMRPDGSAQTRLTYYNHARCAEHEWRPLTVSDNSWGPGGDRIVAFVATDLIRQVGRIDLIVFERP
ncbi:MAG: hypothetical protein HC822_27100 [Oscillochloris sp.]|nr:hypothetical protein [Oscillochloris sp.]